MACSRLQQLQAIGADLPQVALAPQGQQGLGWLKTFDLKLSYPRKFGENFTLEPSVSVFNAFNNANFDLPSTTIGPTLNLANSPCDITDPTHPKLQRYCKQHYEVGAQLESRPTRIGCIRPGCSARG